MADFDEKRIYEAFGLGEQAQDLADPAAEPSGDPVTGEQVQGIAAPATTETQPETDPQAEPTAGTADPEEPEDSGTAAGTGEQTMSAEQRRENAARRRQQEKEQQQAAIQQAVAEAVKQTQDKHNADLAGFFAQAGLKNTFTGEPITSIEQFHSWNEQFQASRLERDLKAGKLTQEALNTAIGNHPAVKQAQQLIDKDADAQRAQEQAAAKARIDAEVAQIHQIDASISSLEDLFKAPYGKEFYEMTRRGYSVKDAHYLLTKDTLEAAKLEAARQAGINSVRSKDHLNATDASRGSGNITVPNADMEMYRLFNPNATAAQIQEHYNKNLKK